MATKFGVLTHKHIKVLSVKFVDLILRQSTLEPIVKEAFTLLVEVYSGRELNGSLKNIHREAPDFTFLHKVEKLIVIVTELFLPDLKSAEGIFHMLVNLVTALLQVKSLSEFSEVICEFAPQVGSLFNADPVIVKGLVGILKGDYEAMAQMAAPIAKIDPETIRSTVQFLEEIKGALS